MSEWRGSSNVSQAYSFWIKPWPYYSLGGSGSGKTTLLNAIANRISGLPTTNGEVAYYSAGRHAEITRGMKLEKGQVKKRIGFVRQQDFLVECLTGESWYRNPSRDVLNRPHSSRNINLCMACVAHFAPLPTNFFFKTGSQTQTPDSLVRWRDKFYRGTDYRWTRLTRCRRYCCWWPIKKGYIRWRKEVRLVEILCWYLLMKL